MGCKFSIGDKVRINKTAEYAFDRIGQTATVVEAELSGLKNKESRRPIEYDTRCLVTIRFEDGTIIDEIPESELDPI